MNTEILKERILTEVASHPTISMRELARRLEIQPVLAGKLIEELMNNGQLLTDLCLPNHLKAVGPISCIMETTISAEKLLEFKAMMNNSDEVEFCYQVAADACFLIKVQQETYEDIKQFIRQLKPVVQTVIPLVFPSEMPSA